MKLSRSLRSCFSYGLCGLIWLFSAHAWTQPIAMPHPHPLGADPSPSSRRVALLIGISEYTQPMGVRTQERWPRLHTEQDIAEMKKVLRKFQFQEGDIWVLQNAAATKQAIIQAVEQHLIASASPGSVIVLYFAGHGHQVPDVSGDELDDLDEALVAYRPPNAGDTSLNSDHITDDEVATWLQRLQKRMNQGGKVRGSINVFVDACATGTLHRDLATPRGRRWDPALDGDAPPPAAERRRALQPSAKDPLSFIETTGDYVVMTAARSDQAARERHGMGAFTFALTNALGQAGPGATYRTLLDLVSADLARHWVFEQTPQLEGDADKLLFSDRLRPSTPFMQVARNKEGKLVLPWGSLHFVTEGSSYRLYSPGGGSIADATPLGLAKVTRTHLYSSELELIATEPGVTAEPRHLLGARAVEYSHCYRDDQIRVHLHGLVAQPALAHTIRTMSVVREILAPQQEADLSFTLSSDGATLHVRRAEDGSLLTQLPVDVSVAAKLDEFLRTRFRWLRLSALRHENPQARVSLFLKPYRQLDHNGLRTPLPRQTQSGGPSQTNWSQQLSVQPGQEIVMQLRNESDRDLFVTVIELDEDGRCQVAFPSTDAPHDRLIRRRARITLPAEEYLFRADLRPGRSLFRTIATTSPLPWVQLLHQACEVAVEPTRQAQTLRSLLANTAGLGSGLAALLFSHVATDRVPSEQHVPVDDWGTTDAMLATERTPAWAARKP